MKKRLVLLILMGIVWSNVWAQYYGESIFREGFDNDLFPASWTQENETPADPCRWVSTAQADVPFSKVDAASTHSAFFSILKGNKPMLKITSPEIDLSGKSEIIVGFYGYRLSNCFRSMDNMNLLFRISKDNGSSWTDLYNSNSSKPTSSISSWDLYKYTLPEAFNHSKVKLQFFVNGANYSGPYGGEGLIDGVFVSERFTVDPILTSINYSVKPTVPTQAALTKEEPVIVGLTNGGKSPITSIELSYQVNDGAPIVETFTPLNPILTNENVKYTFKTKADLSACQTFFTIKVNATMPNDGDLTNNRIEGYLENLTQGIPYIARFFWIEDGVPSIEDDNWTTLEKEDDAGWWEQDYDKGFWYIDNEYSDADCDAYLISCPVYLEAGKTYDMKFSAYVDAVSSGEELNRMKVFVTTDPEMEEDLNLIWQHDAIDDTSALNSFARYSVTEGGIYYFAFNCTSPITADYLKVDDISIREVVANDAGVLSLIAPAAEKYLYDNQETVSLLIRNYGATAIPAGSMQVAMQLNDASAVIETVQTALEPNETLIHSFSVQIDPSNVNIQQNLKMWTKFVNDKNPANDTLSVALSSIVGGVPYIPYFGIDRQPSNEPSYWTVLNLNKDNYTFASVYDIDLKTYVFSYGGNSPRPLITVKTSNEQLFTRPIRLIEGNIYKIVYQSRIEKSGGAIPLKVELYKMEGETRTFVKEIFAGDITSTVYLESIYDFMADATGIYELCFSTLYAEPIDYKIKLGGFRLIQKYDTDLALDKVLLPGSSFSCYNTVPLGAIITNEGKNTIHSFILKAESPSIGSKEKHFTTDVAPEESFSCYLNEDFVFNGSDAEVVTMSVIVEGDEYLYNNSKSEMVTYVEPATIPYSVPLYAAPEGWVSLNNNRDPYRFEFKSGTSPGYQYTAAAHVEADDVLATRCIGFEQGKFYSLAFSYKTLLPQDTTSFSVYALHAESGTQVAIANLSDVSISDLKGKFVGYFTVPQNGAYALCFKLSGKTGSLQLYSGLDVTEVDSRPDVTVDQITTPASDAVFTADETVTVKFVNAGTKQLATIPFTCVVGDKTYHAIYYNTLLVGGTEQVVDFKHVDLFAPGEYTLKVTADVSADATPDNNTVLKTLRSLPVLDAMTVDLETPVSGVLGVEEQITIVVRNNGKGALTDVPVNCAITASDFNKTLTGIVPGPLADGEQVSYTFDEKVDLYAEDTYTFRISVALEGDVNKGNDVIEEFIVSSHKEFDAGVAAILAPVDNLMTNTETVKIQVKNFSQVDLFRVPVKVEVKHATDTEVKEQLLTGTIEKLKAGESVDYTFTQSVDLKRYGDYLFKAYTVVPGDVNPDNDFCLATVKSFRMDVGVIAITSPESGFELGEKEISIEVKNFGESTVSMIPVSYQVGAMPQLGTVTGPIAPGEKVSFTFVAHYTFKEFKTYTITAMTRLDGDIDPSNDTCVKKVNNKPNGLDESGLMQLVIYPNPATDRVCISSGEELIRSITVYNTQGVPVVIADKVNASIHELSLVDLMNGPYMLCIETYAGIYTKKLLVNR